MTVERIFLKPQISFLGENKKRPSKGNPLEAHISSCFYCLRCGKFFYQYGKAYFLENKAGGRAHFLALRRQAAQHPLETVGAKLRDMMPWLHDNDQKD